MKIVESKIAVHTLGKNSVGFRTQKLNKVKKQSDAWLKSCIALLLLHAKEEEVNKMQKINTKKGISLIVLAITIIVMIILASAIILSLNNAGIIGNANIAVDESNMDTIKSEADLKYSEYLINKAVAGGMELETWLNKNIQHEGYVIRVINKQTVVLKQNSLSNAFLEGTIKVGDYVNYKAGINTKEVTQYTLENSSIVEGKTAISSSDDLKWRVLGIADNGELLLTLEGVSNTKISLGGKEGYYNGEQILHDACGVYGMGDYATGARSITKEDIDKITNVDYSNLVCRVPGIYEISELRILYGLQVTTGAQKNVINAGIANKDIYLTKTFYHLGNSVTDGIVNSPYVFKHTFLDYTIANEMQNISTSDNAYKMLFRTSDDSKNLEYIVANRSIGFTCLLDEGITYSLHRIYNGAFSEGLMFHGEETRYRNFVTGYSLKPVVSINKSAGYIITETTNGVNTWNLK